jgi:hypothetical protein
VSVFKNEQFSRHLIFEKKKFGGGEKNIFYPDKQELCFFRKKKFSFFFEKKVTGQKLKKKIRQLKIFKNTPRPVEISADPQNWEDVMTLDA